jgi:capsular polysaccharide biosynthesis protein
MAQPPQFSLSARVSRHCGLVVGPQSFLRGSQMQPPAWQMPTPQSWPQAPQLRRSVWSSTHWGLALASQSRVVPQAHSPEEQVPVPQS